MCWAQLLRPLKLTLQRLSEPKAVRPAQAALQEPNRLVSRRFRGVSEPI